MAGRTVISYDDITLPYDPIEAPAPAPKPSGQPPSKKRKKNNQKAKQWDNSGGRSPNNAKSASNSQRAELNAYNGGSHSNSRQGQHAQEGEEEWEDEGEYEEEESRELTHDEIWDDSALVGAWESAMEEYKAYNGTKDDWKKEPLTKPPLWYNVPVDPSRKPINTSVPKHAIVIPVVPPTTTENESEGNSQPLNFDTFVPTHDASLQSSEAPPNPVPTNYTTDTPGAVVSRDEAFSRALSAMYWSGYWTAMYHAQSQNATVNVNSSAPATNLVEPEVEAEEQEDDEDEEMEGDEESDDFTPTQR